MKKVFLTLIIVLSANGQLVAGDRYCRAYCVEVSSVPDITTNAHQIYSSTVLNALDANSLVVKCKVAEKFNRFAKLKLLKTYNIKKFKMGTVEDPSEYLGDYIASTDSNSCSDPNEKALLDEVGDSKPNNLNPNAVKITTH